MNTTIEAIITITGIMIMAIALSFLVVGIPVAVEAYQCSQAEDILKTPTHYILMDNCYMMDESGKVVDVRLKMLVEGRKSAL